MNDLTEDAVQTLRSRYPDLHPLIFQRTMEKVHSLAELFDILESVPKPPIVWDDAKRHWVKETDLVGHKRLKKK